MFLNLCAIHYLLTNVSVGYVSCYAKLLPRTSSLMHSRLVARVFATVKYGVDTKSSLTFAVEVVLNTGLF